MYYVGITQETTFNILAMEFGPLCVCVIGEESEQYLRGVFYSHIMGDVTEHTKNYYYCGSYTELNLNQKCV